MYGGFILIFLIMRVIKLILEILFIQFILNEPD